MAGLLRKLFKQSSIYFVGGLLTKGAGFLLLPLYTAYLTPGDYGIVGLATVVASIFGIISTGGLNSAALKFYYTFDDEHVRRKFYGSLWMFLLFVPGIFLLVFEIKGELIFSYILPSVGYHPYLRLALWTVYLQKVFFEIPQNLFKASRRASKYTLLNISIFTGSTLATIWLVVIREDGAQGLLLARLLGNVLVAIAISVYLFKLIQLSLKWNWIKMALVYSLPLVPHFLSHWVLSSSDRLVLEYFVTLDEVGIYNVGYTIGSAMLMIAVAGNNAIIPLYGSLDLRSETRIREIVKTTTYYIAVIVSIGLMISMFASDIVYLILPGTYHNATLVIPWVVLGYVFMGFYFTQINLLTITLGKTKVVGLSTVIAAVSNLGLNILLIPYLGMRGAAISTALTYLVLFLGLNHFSRRAYPLPFEYARMAKAIMIAIAVFLVCHHSAPDVIYLSIIVKVMGMMGFLLFLYFLSFFSKAEVNLIRNKLYRRINNGQ